MYNSKDFMKEESAQVANIRAMTKRGYLTEDDLRGTGMGFAAIRMMGWVMSKLYNGMMALAKKPNHEDIRLLGFEMECLKRFLGTLEYDVLEREMDAILKMQEAVLLDVHAAGGVDAIDIDDSLFATYMNVKNEVATFCDKIHECYRETVQFVNVF